MIKTLNNIGRDRLEILLYRIRNNSASSNDYQEFENLLIQAGFNRDEIRKNLYIYDISDWENFYHRKQEAKSYEQKRLFEVIIKGSLIGLGLAALISIAKDK